MCKHFPLHASVGCSGNIYTKEVYFCVRFELPRVAAILGHSLPMKSRIRLSNDVYDTFATHSGLVNVTDNALTMSLTQTAFPQYGSTHCHIFAPFKCCF